MFGFTPSALNVAACFSNTSLKKTVTAWPNMTGSETFIIVALRCSDSSRPRLPWRPRSAASKNARSALDVHHRRVEDLAGLTRPTFFFSTVIVPIGADELEADIGRLR